MKDEDIDKAERPHQRNHVASSMVLGLVTPFNENVAPPKNLPPSFGPELRTRRASKPKPPPGPVDMEMYARPQPDMRSDDYKDGYNAGYDDEPFIVKNMNWTSGYRDGKIDAVEDKASMDRTGSSNA